VSVDCRGEDDEEVEMRRRRRRVGGFRGLDGFISLARPGSIGGFLVCFT